LDSKTREGRTREPLRSERGSSLARILATGALIAAIVLVALAMFGDAGSYRVKAVFDNAGQLVPGNQVRVGGQPVGRSPTSSWTTRRTRS
jgi:ABC-type transporter Mla subunit MlaD